MVSCVVFYYGLRYLRALYGNIYRENNYLKTEYYKIILDKYPVWKCVVGSNPTLTATCTSQTRDEVPYGAFFLFGSKGFSDATRLSETGASAEIGL